MNTRLDAVLLIFTIARVKAKEPELPPCPTNMQFFPQNLPMHCRMEQGSLSEQLQNPTMSPFPPGYFQSPSPDKLPNPIPFTIPGFPPGFPGLPPGLPPGIPGPGPMPMPGLGPMPMPMPMPMPAPGPAHKLPVIVMPFYSPDPTYKKHSDTAKPPSYGPGKFEIHQRRSPLYETDKSSDDSSDTSTSSEGRAWWKRRRGLKRSGRNFRNGRRMNRKHKAKRRGYNKRDLLTPILQYVTKDGYVIFEKKISKDEATDWLSMKKEKGEKRDEPDLADIQNVYRDNDLGEPGEVNADVELLNEDKSKEQVEVQTQNSLRKHHPHKLRSHHTKNKEEVPS